MVFHPVRPGESRALRRKDFNLENMTVHIQRAFSKKVEKCRKGKVDYYLPISSRFDISILKNMLPEAFVFLNEEGRPYKPENLRRIWHRACKKAGVPRIKMYNGTRHSTATDVLIKTNGNFNTVSRILGRSTPEMAKK